jgi:hypothetical protein
MRIVTDVLVKQHDHDWRQRPCQTQARLPNMREEILQTLGQDSAWLAPAKSTAAGMRKLVRF